MNKKIFLLTIFCFLIIFNLIAVQIVFANNEKEATCITSSTKEGNCVTTPAPGGPVSLTDPLKNITPQRLIGRIINAALGIVGSLALLMFIYGGFVWMMAGGASDKVEKGKNILLWATIGLIVIFASYSLVNFVIKSIST